MMSVMKKIGNMDVIDSGILLLHRDIGEELSLSVELGKNSENVFKFIVKFIFESDNTSTGAVRKNVDMDNNTITIHCVNFKSQFGSGIPKPMELATYEGSKIYLNFIGYSLFQKKVLKIEYCLYISHNS